jgi:hypothetical protein
LPPLVLFHLQAARALQRNPLEERRRSDTPTPTRQGCRGQQIQISLFPAAYFHMKLERMKLRSIPCHRAPSFLCPTPLLGWDLVVVAVEGGQTKGLILLCPYLRQGRERSRGMKREDGKACCRVALFTQDDDKGSLLGVSLAHAQKNPANTLFSLIR